MGPATLQPLAQREPDYQILQTAPNSTGVTTTIPGYQETVQDKISILILTSTDAELEGPSSVQSHALFKSKSLHPQTLTTMGGFLKLGTVTLIAVHAMSVLRQTMDISVILQTAQNISDVIQIQVGYQNSVPMEDLTLSAEIVLGRTRAPVSKAVLRVQGQNPHQPPLPHSLNTQGIMSAIDLCHVLN